MADSSLPPCCPPGSWPQLMRSTDQSDSDDIPKPRGQVVTVKTDQGDDLPIYYVEPDGGDKKGCIMVLQDVYSIPVFSPDSHSFGRIEAICDALADQGYMVALPNIFRAEPYDIAISAPDTSKGETWTTQNVFAPPGSVEWFKKFNYDTVKPTVVATAHFLRGKIGESHLKMACLGFCYGTWLLTKASVEGDVDFCCAVGCHPATVLEEAVHGGNQVELLESVKMPLLFLAAKNDSDVFHSGAPGREALEKSGGGVIDFPDMIHGWVSRGDTSDEQVKRDVEKAMRHIVEFLGQNMA